MAGPTLAMRLPTHPIFRVRVALIWHARTGHRRVGKRLQRGLPTARSSVALPDSMTHQIAGIEHRESACNSKQGRPVAGL